MYAIDSKGNIYNDADEPDIYSILSANKRVESLCGITNKITDSLKKSGLDIKDDEKEKVFTYLFQPFDLHDSIVVFVRTPMSSSCDEVKIAYYMRTDKEKAKLIRSNIANGLKTDFTDDMLMSIFCEKIKGKVSWYMLNVLVIDIERNAYDGEIISLKVRPCIDYRTFAKTFSSKILRPKKGENPKTPENLNKYLLYSPAKHNVFNEKEVFESAMTASGAEFFEKAREEISGLLAESMTGKDEYSNIKCNCINFIKSNPVDKIYPIYVLLKKNLFKLFPDVKSVMYKGSRIYFTLKDYGRQCAYICDKEEKGDAETVYFIINGHVYHGIKEMVRALSDYKTTCCFTPVAWFVINNKDIITYYFKDTVF